MIIMLFLFSLGAVMLQSICNRGENIEAAVKEYNGIG